MDELREQCGAQIVDLFQVRIPYAKLEYQYLISISQQNHIDRITERNSITRTTQIYPGKTLKGKTQQRSVEYSIN